MIDWVRNNIETIQKASVAVFKKSGGGDLQPTEGELLLGFLWKNLGDNFPRLKVERSRDRLREIHDILSQFMWKKGDRPKIDDAFQLGLKETNVDLIKVLVVFNYVREWHGKWLSSKDYKLWQWFSAVESMRMAVKSIIDVLKGRVVGTADSIVEHYQDHLFSPNMRLNDGDAFCCKVVLHSGLVGVEISQPVVSQMPEMSGGVGDSERLRVDGGNRCGFITEP